MYKIIILGPPLTGKTTLTNYLRDNLKLPVVDMDKELLRLNGGKWPGNYSELNKRLINHVITDVLAIEDVILSAFYFGIDELKEARVKGFEVVQLEIDKAIVIARNQERLKLEPDNDAFQYYEKNLTYQMKIRKQGLVDRIIRSDKPVEEIAKELLLK